MKILIHGCYGSNFRLPTFTTTDSKITVFEEPQNLYITCTHDKYLDNSVVGEVVQQKRHGPLKKGRGGKIKRW